MSSNTFHLQQFRKSVKGMEGGNGTRRRFGSQRMDLCIQIFGQNRRRVGTADDKVLTDKDEHILPLPALC